ncbi:MAG: hypothetical protein ACI9LI_000678 [Saprospiraceae bacterium]|jgi:hypothetical protein
MLKTLSLMGMIHSEQHACTEPSRSMTVKKK